MARLTSMPKTKKSGSPRDRLLDSVEAIMVEKGHAAVSYRTVATRAGVGASNVQYYFSTLDELLVATVRRRTEQSIERLMEMLQARPDQPLRTLWQFANDETTATLSFEFSAMGIHRESVRSETVSYMKRLRHIQVAALGARRTKGKTGCTDIPSSVLLFLLGGIPKLIQMEAAFDTQLGHHEVVDLVEQFLDANEPA